MSKRKTPPPVPRHPHGPPRREAGSTVDSPRSDAAESDVWLFGIHAVAAALANPKRHCHRLLATRQGEENLGTLPAGAPRAQIVDKREIDRLLAAGAVHQGVALQAEPVPDVDIEDILADPPERAVIVVLDQATDPRNVGAVLRAGAAFGASAVIMPDRHSPADTGTLAKAASGAFETVPLVRVTNLVRALERIKEAGFWCAGLDGSASTALAEADLSGRIALVLGAEGPGLRRLTREHCDLVVRIPISPRIESLNLATAAAVALYEVARRT
jgi:23S rRNA (guanosine2251-2'-O)-methyltransferase